MIGTSSLLQKYTVNPFSRQMTWTNLIALRSPNTHLAIGLLRLLSKLALGSYYLHSHDKFTFIGRKRGFVRVDDQSPLQDCTGNYDLRIQNADSSAPAETAASFWLVTEVEIAQVFDY